MTGTKAITDLSRNEQIMKFFVQSCENRLGRTQLVKLMYLADHEARRYLGVPLSTFVWSRQPRGPFTEEFYAVKASLTAKDQIKEIEDVTAFGNPWYQYVDGGGHATFDFTPEESRILAYVVRVFGKKSREEILEDVYSTQPFLNVQDAPRDTPLPMDIVNNERSSAMGGISVAAVIEGERRIRAGEGIPFSALIRSLRTATAASAV